MSNLKRGKQSYAFLNSPVIAAWASVAGKKEKEGPLGNTFDLTVEESHYGQDSWEQGEQKMQQLALDTVLTKAKIAISDLDVIFSGDLLNQCIGSSFTLRNKNVPHIGLYGACSTMAESLLLSGLFIGAGYGSKAIAMTSSHFAASERQYRFPLGYGGQRPPTAQWTVTGSGAALICDAGEGPYIESCTIGTVCDLGIKDANNMGAAMAPAALSTIRAHLEDMNTAPEDFDMIVTGDLGQLGKESLLELARMAGLNLGGKLMDCGTMVFDCDTQDVHCGGSGCGCSAITLCGELLNKLNAGKLKRILFCGTGALLSPTSTQQGMPIPGICHAVSIHTGRI